MGSVLSFSPRDAANTQKPPLASGSSATIVIFPGVRYERREQDGRKATADSAKLDKPKH